MNLKQGICTLLLVFSGTAAPAANIESTPESGDIAAHYARFIPRPDVQTEQRGNLQLTSVLAAGAAPTPAPCSPSCAKNPRPMEKPAAPFWHPAGHMH